MRDDTRNPVDVVIVGAGLAGLNAARTLRRAGRRIVVLEARGEVGGRTRTREIDGRTVDFGGEWIGRAHRRMCALVRELGLHTEPARNIGHPVLWRLPSGNTCRRLPPPRALVDIAKVFACAGRDSRGIDPTAPWAAPDAERLDARSVADWLDDRRLGIEGRYLIERLIGSPACQNLDSMSLLQMLWFFRLAGGPLRSANTTFQWRIAEGAQEISVRIARELGPESIRLNTPVHRLQQVGGVVVAEAGQLTVHARHAIVATPVPQVAHVEFDPPLPTALAELSQLNVGAGIKVIAGLPSGHPVKHNTVLGGRFLWGAWRRDDRVTGFVPPMAGAVSDADLMDDLADAFGVKTRADLRCPTVFRWADERYIGGCDAVFAPGQVCGFGPLLTRPHGLIHFAGVGRSSWPDNMEGAVRSGERAARDVLLAVR
ncbi:NAD(P)/FAD-dependent oxidoreductase [Mycobacterium sp. DL440]|uniref:flavin monoamine oxidase family protein n=1 Tax=Mycobacterium sp. DL440 TaxID=2675523 RepID=UPI00141E8307|nr:NAD(P)/FAD-dependent oxidoreductase [Mycobacterium sp. DL440]